MKIFVRLGFYLAGLCLSGQAALAADADKRLVHVQLLAINDLHGFLEPVTGPDGSVNGVPAGGTEYLATHLREAIRANPRSIFVGAGDMMGASSLLSGASKDKPTIEALNAMKMGVTSIGNHELDNGADEFLRRAKSARYRYIAANVLRSDTKRPLLPGTRVVRIGGVRIGFIGATLEGTGRLLSPAAQSGLSFLEESGAANAEAARLEALGVRAIVLLIHEGGQQNLDANASKDAPIDPDGCANFSGDIIKVAEKLSPSIKLVVSAHSHKFYSCEIAGHRVTSAGSFGRLFTSIDLSIDARSGEIAAIDARNVINTRDVAPDPRQTAIIRKYKPAVDRFAHRIVGSATATLDRENNASGESALGDIIADAVLLAGADHHAQIGFVNSGGVRTSIHMPDGQARRDVSYSDLYTTQPFGNHLTVITMTGEEIRQLLEQQFRPEGQYTRFLQISNGLSYQYRDAAPLGAKIVPGSLRLNGQPLTPDQQIIVVTSDFLIGGGDGFTLFGKGRDPSMLGLDVDALVKYFEKKSPVSPGPQNRFTKVD